MQRIAQFMKVSRERFEADWQLNAPCDYDSIRLPKRATSGSAGYDFYSPVDFELKPGEFIRIPTGVRVKMEAGWVLLIAPRSGQGFRYRAQLYNTLGVIDADYFGAANEGHIAVKLINASPDGRTLRIRKGEAYAQGVFLPFGLTEDDDATQTRTGGFGSTSARDM